MKPDFELGQLEEAKMAGFSENTRREDRKESNLGVPDRHSWKSALQELGRYGTVIFIVLGTTTLADFLLNRIFTASAGTPDIPPPAPSSRLVLASGMPSQKDIQEQAKSFLQGTEPVQINPYHLEFDLINTNLGIDHYRWTVSNAYWGFGPNNPITRTGTVRVTINGVARDEKNFQGLQSLGPRQPVLAQAIGGIAVSIPGDRHLLAGETLRSDRNYDPYVEGGSSLPSAEAYINRSVVWKGLPQHGLTGRYTPVTFGTDNDGNYANISFLFADEVNDADCVVVAECGTYQIRLDSQYYFIGDTFTKLPNPATPTATVPIPTYTPSPTSTAVPYNTPVSTAVSYSFRSYLPIAIRP